MTNPQKPESTTQAGELLGELESIKSLLDDDDLNSIPLLEEMIDDTLPIVDKLAVSDDIPTLDEPSKLPGQQGLFDNTSKTGQKPRTEPSSDNPFLPKHIRDRLGSSTDYVKELEQQQRNLEKQSLTMSFSHRVPSVFDEKNDQNNIKTLLQKTIANPDELIDALVQQYLPIIEDELRAQLKKLADKG